MACDPLTLYVANTNYLEVDVVEGLTGYYDPEAEASATLYDSSGNEVEGEDWPVTLDYDAETDGTYRATLPDTLELVSGARYRFDINVLTSGGEVQHTERAAVALDRTC